MYNINVINVRNLLNWTTYIYATFNIPIYIHKIMDFYWKMNTEERKKKRRS